MDELEELEKDIKELKDLGNTLTSDLKRYKFVTRRQNILNWIKYFLFYDNTVMDLDYRIKATNYFLDKISEVSDGNRVAIKSLWMDYHVYLETLKTREKNDES